MTPIDLVLDASAVRLFPHVNIGEPVTQVDENGAAFTVALPSLAEAARDDGGALRILLGHPAFRGCDLPYGQWRQYAAMLDVLGSHDTAAALLLASVHRCHILTADPAAYRPLGDDPPIIEA